LQTRNRELPIGRLGYYYKILK